MTFAVHPSTRCLRRRVGAALLAVLAAGAGLGLPALGHAAGYPERPIRLIVPWAPGGATDVIARLIGQPLSQALGQPVVVDNKPGAGGNIGTGQFVREKADGYTLLLGTSSTNAVNPSLYAKLPFDAVRDFAPVIHIATVPNILVVPAKSPLRSVDDLVARARAEPGKLDYGSGGNGSSQHLAGSMFARATGLSLVHVPYKGSGPAASDLIAGHLAFMLDTGSMPHIKGGSLRALAVAAPARLAVLPQVPTFDELGIKGMHASAWYGLMAPAGTPPEVVQRLATETQKILRDPEVAQRLADFGAVVQGGTPAQFQAFVLAEIERYRRIVRESGAAID